MRSKRSWAWAGLGASSLLAFLTACGSVSEDFKIIVVTPDAGQDAAPSEDATVADAATDAASDATSDATIPDGSVQDAQVDAGVDAGLVVPDGGSVIMVGDAAVVIPPLDPSLLGDGGLRLSDGGLANADGGALTPRQFRDLVNGITCQRISECCCPGCTTAEQAQTVSAAKCASGLGANGLLRILFGNENIPTASLRVNSVAMIQCLSLVNNVTQTCQSIQADQVATLRAVCLDAFASSAPIGSSCNLAFDCAMPARCASLDGGAKTCQPLASEGEACVSGSDCTPRGVQGTPPLFCRTVDAGTVCAPYLRTGEVCPFESACGSNTCIVSSDSQKRCSSTLPFAAQGDPASYCTSFAP